MYRIIDKRGSGKTSRLMLLAKETGATIVCKNPAAMEQKALRYGFTGITFVGYQDACKEILHDRNVLIDELDNFLSATYGKKVLGYSLTSED